MIELPEDIILYIFEFNPLHREKFKLVFEDIEIKSALFKTQRMVNFWNNIAPDERPSFYLFIIDSIFIDDMQTYVKALNKCKCCQRHQFNKSNQDNWTTNFETKSTGHMYCSCPCRHTTRICCVASPGLWQTPHL